MSAEETGKVPSALARRFIRKVNRLSGNRRLYWTATYEEVLALQLDREIAKGGAFIPAETLDKVELALEKFAACSHDEHDEWRAICPRHAARLALESLRSERKPL